MRVLKGTFTLAVCAKLCGDTAAPELVRKNWSAAITTLMGRFFPKTHAIPRFRRGGQRPHAVSQVAWCSLMARGVIVAPPPPCEPGLAAPLVPLSQTMIGGKAVLVSPINDEFLDFSL